MKCDTTHLKIRALNTQALPSLILNEGEPITDPEVIDAIARRICACVNACTGLTTEFLAVNDDLAVTLKNDLLWAVPRVAWRGWDNSTKRHFCIFCNEQEGTDGHTQHAAKCQYETLMRWVRVMRPTGEDQNLVQPGPSKADTQIECAQCRAAISIEKAKHCDVCKHCWCKKCAKSVFRMGGDTCIWCR